MHGARETDLKPSREELWSSTLLTSLSAKGDSTSEGEAISTTSERKEILSAGASEGHTDDEHFSFGHSA